MPTPAPHTASDVRLHCLVLLSSALFLLGGYVLAAATAQAQAPTDSLNGLPEAAYAPLEVLNVRDADLRDVLRGIAHQSGLNLVVDNRIDARVTVRLADLPVLDAVVFLCREHGLRLTRSGRVLRIDLPPELPAPRPPPPRVFVEDGLLSADLQGEELAAVIHEITHQSDHSIIVQRGASGPLTGTLNEVPFEAGLRSLLNSNGFSMKQQDGIYHVGRIGSSADEEAPSNLWVTVQDGTVSLDVEDAPLANVLREVVAQLGLDLVTYQQPEGRLTARVAGLTPDEALILLFKGTDTTFRREGDVYIVGNRRTQGIASTRLLRLDHIRADAVLELLPAPLLEAATIQVVKEHNGLMVTGTHDAILDLERFIEEVDYPTPQILIEALVVDFESTDLLELGLELGRDAERAAEVEGRGFSLDLDGAGARGYQLEGGARKGQRYVDGLNALTGLFGFRRIGRLPDDFYLQIHALQQEGRVEIRSRPQVATLNGHTASISIGTTQYFILRTNTPYTSPGQVLLRETERFEKIEANVRLEITPWVSAAGEVTADIRPEFSTPVGELDPQVPPTINTRVLESTVRLHDGETIILGGLIQEVEAVTYRKVPVLGSIPLLGRLFSGREREARQAELVIFLTPHVFYGDERDDERWRRLRDRLELQGEDGLQDTR